MPGANCDPRVVRNRAEHAFLATPETDSEDVLGEDDRVLPPLEGSVDEVEVSATSWRGLGRASRRVRGWARTARRRHSS
jgi:hypothetical protein